MWSRCDHDGLGFCICNNIRYHFSCLVLAFFRITDFIFQESETLLMDIYLSIFWLALYPRPEWDVIIMICQSTNNCPSNIWEHLTPLQHSNTPTRRHLRTWSCDLLEPGSRDHTFSGGRSRAGGKMSVTLWRWFYIHILNTWTKHGIKARWRDFNHWRLKMLKLKIADWCENLLCYWSLVLGTAWSASIIKCGEPI